MKAYGLPRNLEVQWPDKVDLKVYGRKSFGKKKWPRSERRAHSRSTVDKQQTRRYWKRQARRQGRIDINKQVNDE